MPVGMHLSVSGGIHKLPDIARKIGAETYQIFASSPTSWRYGEWDPEKVALFRQKRTEYGQQPLVVHTGYLINLASAKPEVRAKSLVALGQEFKKADAIGADYLVYHPGKHLGDGVEVGLERIINNVLAVLTEHQPRTLLLLENSEGSGTCLGVSFEELTALLT
ncbi:TIM barrel protein [bacterium]|nr:TIM barrel protein [bacterium]